MLTLVNATLILWAFDLIVWCIILKTPKNLTVTFFSKALTNF